MSNNKGIEQLHVVNVQFLYCLNVCCLSSALALLRHKPWPPGHFM